MEFESGGTLEAVDELRQARIARPRNELGELDAREWLRVWSEAESWGKTAAVEVEVRVRRSARPRVEVWTRAEAQGRAAASGARVVKRCWWVARVDLHVEWANEVICTTWEEIREEVERAEAEAWAQTPGGVGTSRCVGRLVNDQGHPVRPLCPLAQNERRIFMPHCTYFITPINRLPLELLPQIILTTIEEMGGPPLVLMHVTQSGHPMMTSQHRQGQSLRTVTGKALAQVARPIQSLLPFL